ncbi:MFS monosaccharide transporter [Colletotrichum truncatum]|uniref:MFS monosaccharide transporter n=1 Tax=Colletotrichum truncatum TaxID=5467 RepID=A0ACC3YLB9_COLTU|nr:MFS monosaccharide transporter [Colletotrichum truncatum]KAF6781970.1 MFS monosaccharide transporter [Colletotrichum truncatum]
MAPPQRQERIVPCEKCREKHIKCDGETPCSSCKKAEDRCVRVDKRFRFKRMVASKKKYSFNADQPWLHTNTSTGKITSDLKIFELALLSRL